MIVSRTNSRLGAYLFDLAEMDTQLEETTSRKVGRISLVAIALAFGYGCGIVYYNASSSYPDPLVANISRVGSFLAFGSFTAFDSMQSVLAFFHLQTPTEKVLLHNFIPQPVRVSNVALSIILGVFSQYPLVEIALSFSDQLAVGIVLSAIVLLGTTAPPAVSMYRGLVRCESELIRAVNILSSNRKTRLLQMIKEILIENAEERLDWRKKPLSFESNTLLDVRALSKRVFTNPQIIRNDSNKSPRWLKVPLSIIHTLFALNALISYCTLASILSSEATQKFTREYVVVVLFCLLTFMPWIPKLMRVPGSAVVRLIHLGTDALGFRREKSFVEEYYPTSSRVSVVASTLIAATPYGALNSITTRTFDETTAFGQYMIIGNIVTVMLLFNSAVYCLMERALLKYSSSCASPEVRGAKMRMDRSDRFLNVMRQICLADLNNYLQSMKRKGVLQQLIGTQICEDDLQYITETNSLVLNV